ncbi:hypothetical protein F9948_05795 [Burkholderia thailandensis]|nr:hypothetical protein [Burkholderia thailandensis]MDD1487016.1 hypothetical protein [Burkholderia thailandensis]MDD1492559.1 hypothetical protein [Burkholderia thailandensis]
MVSRHALRTRGRTYSERFGKIRREMRDARCAAPRLMRPASGIEATSMPRQCGARDIHIENASLCAPTASLNLNP